MITIPEIRTRRFTATLQELSLGSGIALARGNPDADQLQTTQLLRSIVTSVSNPQLTDPADWTVQERIYVVSSYMAAVLPDGPDFKVGDGSYGWYLFGTLEHREPEALKDGWRIRHLTGRLAESVERLALEDLDLEPRSHWLLGCLCGQLYRDGDSPPDSMSDSDRDEWLYQRIRALLDKPESECASAIVLFREGMEALHHLVKVDFGSEGGLICLPNIDTKGVPVTAAGARFPVHAAVSAVSRKLV